MAAGRILRTGAGTVGLMGLTFKAGTDDLRESPQVELAASLIARGRSLLIYDPNVQLSHIVGLNREYLQSRIPRISEILCASPERLIAECGVLVVGNKTAEYKAALQSTRPEQTVVDLVRLVDDPAGLNAAYDGLCW
ncbi:MAG TPA: UDP binding domain-containing protein, partial [Candidatus Eisenbacteria bacterium]